MWYSFNKFSTFEALHVRALWEKLKIFQHKVKSHSVFPVWRKVPVVGQNPGKNIFGQTRWYKPYPLRNWLFFFLLIRVKRAESFQKCHLCTSWFFSTKFPAHMCVERYKIMTRNQAKRLHILGFTDDTDIRVCIKCFKRTRKKLGKSGNNLNCCSRAVCLKVSHAYLITDYKLFNVP